jgi:hypothetical protein
VKWIVVTVVAFAACGGSDEYVAPDAATDAAIDAPPDPYEGMYDEGSDFPRTNCRAGALAGFARTNVWPLIGLRTDAPGGVLRTFVHYAGVEEEELPHILTDDDLIWRHTVFIPGEGRWLLEASDVCDVLADGTLRGTHLFCSAPDACFPPRSFEVAPLHRIAGENESDGLTMVGELALGGRPLNVRVAGGVAYLPMGLDGMRVVSVANPAAPTVVGSYLPAVANYFNDVKLLDAGGRRYALLAGSPTEVIDVTTPASPSVVATIPVGAHTLFVEGTMVYLVEGSWPRLHIFDLADPRAPIRRANYTVPGLTASVAFHDLFVENGIAYVSAASFGLVVIDCRTPTAPVVMAQTDADPGGHYWHSPWRTQVGARTVIAHGDEGAGSGLRLLEGDAASATFLDTLGEWHLRDEVSIHNVMARGATVYVAHYQDGIRVVDISNPAMPVQLGYFNTWREDRASAAYYSAAIGLDLDAANRRIYVADTIRGLLVLEGTSGLFP